MSFLQQRQSGLQECYLYIITNYHIICASTDCNQFRLAPLLFVIHVLTFHLSFRASGQTQDRLKSSLDWVCVIYLKESEATNNQVVIIKSLFVVLSEVSNHKNSVLAYNASRKAFPYNLVSQFLLFPERSHCLLRMDPSCPFALPARGCSVTLNEVM